MVMRLFVDKSKCSVRHVYKFQFTEPLEELTEKTLLQRFLCRVHYLLFDGEGIVNCFHFKMEY